jgi:phage shock protein C
MEPKRLFRNRTEVMLGGVCGGLAKYLNIDPTVVRLVFILLLFIGGSGFWIYMVLWFITPVEPGSSPTAVVEIKTSEVEARPSRPITANEVDVPDQLPKSPEPEKAKSKVTKVSSGTVKPKPGTTGTSAPKPTK